MALNTNTKPELKKTTSYIKTTTGPAKDNHQAMIESEA